jgi:NAD kinase
MPCYYSLDQEPYKVPDVMVKSFRIEIKDANGNWVTCKRIENNYQRLVKLDVCAEAMAVRFIPEETWGSDEVHVFSFEVE